MTGRERVQAALRCQPTDRVPWVPFVGCHAGALIGASAEAVLQSADLLVRGLNRAVERYRPDGLPVLFDLQVEAETLGCALAWAPENPPAVRSHPLANGGRLDALRVPGPDAGRIRMALDAARALRQTHPDLALYGLVTGPFTLALHLRGTDIFTDMFDAPDAVRALMAFAGAVARDMAGYYLDAGCDVVAVVDPMTSQIGPDQFHEWVTPFARPVFDAIRARGGLGSFFVCGHAQQNVAAMCDCGPHNVSVDENIPLEFVRRVCAGKGVSFGGNLQLTSVLLLGQPLDAQRNAVECLDAGGDTGYVLAPGCDLPYAVPPANLAAVAEVVADPYRRDVVRATARAAPDGDRLDLREYGQQDKVVVDIITLDSEACAPCQYMVDAVRRVAPQFEQMVEWREHKIKHREALVFMTSLMVRNVPTICIDGQITFVSRIPPRDELVAAIQKRINDKFRLGILQRKGELHIVGPDGEAAAAVCATVARAMRELGAELPVVRVGDEARFRDYGLPAERTPAVFTVQYRLRAHGRAPEPAAVKEWIKDLL